MPGPLKILEPALKLAYKAFAWIWFRDHTPGDPVLDQDTPKNIGKRIQPQLKFFPASPPSTADPEWWWLNYHGKWGSWHTRIMGSVGVDSPWGPVGHADRWNDPVYWISKFKTRT
jgi:hypothetical protein